MQGQLFPEVQFLYDDQSAFTAKPNCRNGWRKRAYLQINNVKFYGSILWIVWKSTFFLDAERRFDASVSGENGSKNWKTFIDEMRSYW